MILKDAKNIARLWVNEEMSQAPGLVGAFFHGSANWLTDADDLPAGSDLDVMVVFDDGAPPVKTGKLVFRDVLLEISRISTDLVRSPEVVLGDYRLAGSFRSDSVFSDPGGRLTAIQQSVAAGYAERRWVRARCEQAQANVLSHLGSLDGSAPFHEQVTSWLFGTGVTTHIVLAAGLENPTVRKRYLVTRHLLESYGWLDAYEVLLELLGCADMSRSRVSVHLGDLAMAFDAAKLVVKTPFFFAADISDAARPVAINGAQMLIDEGYHREAVFWMVATYARCQKVLKTDGSPAVFEQHDAGFRELVGELGIASWINLQKRSEDVRRALPQVWDVAEAIMAANPDIQDVPV